MALGASDDNRVKLPNVHVGLHFAEFATEYGPLMNCNVLAGEKRHKTFKRWACSRESFDPKEYYKLMAEMWNNPGRARK